MKSFTVEEIKFLQEEIRHGSELVKLVAHCTLFCNSRNLYNKLKNKNNKIEDTVIAALIKTYGNK